MLKSKDQFIPRGLTTEQVMQHLGIGIHHIFGGGVYAKETRIPAGQVLVQHKHKYDHLSILASGSIILDVEGVQVPITGPHCLTVEAGKHHGVKALTDVVWYCLHASDVADDDAVIADPADIAGAKLIEERLSCLG